MSPSRIKANECYHTQHDSQLKEKVINGISDEMMTAEIIRANHNTEEK